MDNYAIADQLSLLAKLMDIHGENAFKAKTYSVAAFTLEKLPEPVAVMPEARLARIRNIGESAAKKITEILQTGTLSALEELIANTPPGVLEMLAIKGLGPKKIHTLWKELRIDTLEELQLACEEHRIAQTKGFGEKTEQKILESIAFVQQNAGKYLYRQIEEFAETFTRKLQEKFSGEKLELTGDYRRQMEIIDKLEWVTTIEKQELVDYLCTDSATLEEDAPTFVSFRVNNNILLVFHLAGEENFYPLLFTTSVSADFLAVVKVPASASSEEEIFQSAGLPFIPPYRRENKNVLENAASTDFQNVIQVNQIKGLIHCHSDWSDGSHKVEEMAQGLIDLGFEYMVISDHSKAASYAGGLTEDRIIQQHDYVDELNEKLKPFKIFKSIECDILGDGSLDYSNEVLSTFDLVITSIHSNLEMPREKAMMRLMGAITNPYTTILGHMTGRLLLKRNGYPVDHKAIIDACAENNIVIEINANPRRLDMDWRWIEYALSKNVKLSIDPDAHSIDEFQLLKYGVLVAQKGGLTAKQNLSSYSLQEFEKFIGDLKKKKLS